MGFFDLFRKRRDQPPPAEPAAPSSPTLPFVIAACMLFLGVAVSGCRDRHRVEDKTIAGPDGPISVKQTTVDMFPQKERDLTAGEVRKISEYAGKLAAFVRAHGVETDKPTLKDCDLAFANWQSAPKPRKYRNEDVTQILGTTLGEHLVHELEMRWIVVTDRYGTDFAVKGKGRDVMAFPFSTVLKRIESGENGFLEPVFDSIRETLRDEKYAPK